MNVSSFCWQKQTVKYYDHHLHSAVRRARGLSRHRVASILEPNRLLVQEPQVAGPQEEVQVAQQLQRQSTMIRFQYLISQKKTQLTKLMFSEEKLERE